MIGVYLNLTELIGRNQERSAEGLTVDGVCLYKNQVMRSGKKIHEPVRRDCVNVWIS